MKKGFTFIELLVVTTIIILLSSVALVSYQSAGRKARDDKRKADLEQIRSVLEMIRSDIGCYPYNDGGTCRACLPPASGAWTCNGVTYMHEFPQDPKGGQHYYYYSANGADYVLCAALESSGNRNGCPRNPRCGNNWHTICNYHLSPP